MYYVDQSNYSGPDNRIRLLRSQNQSALQDQEDLKQQGYPLNMDQGAWFETWFLLNPEC